MTRTQSGVLAMTAACILWGMSTLLYKILAHVPPLEVLAHRTVWSLVFFGTVLALQGRLREIGTIFKSKTLLPLVMASAVVVSINWGVFIWAVQSGHAVEASLGYFIYPLLSVVVASALFRERLDMVQIGAVALAGCAVIFLAWGLGVTPWVSLLLATSFVTYGAIKKKLPLGPVVSVTTEVLLMLPLALIWLWGVHTQGWVGIDGRNVGVFGLGWRDTVLLVLMGPLTAGPLVLFSFAAKRLSFATQGLVFYMNPSLQFALAVLVLGEAVSRWHAIAFPVIWLALLIYSVNALRQEKALRKAAFSAGTVSRTV